MDVWLNGTKHEFSGFRILHESQERCLVEYYKDTKSEKPTKKPVQKRKDKPESAPDDDDIVQRRRRISKKKVIEESDSECVLATTDEEDNDNPRTEQESEQKHDFAETMSNYPDIRDKLTWLHTRELECDLWIYDCTGHRLDPQSKAQKIITFVVVKTGCVMARDHPGLVEVAYLDPKNSSVNSYAPGHLEEIKISGNNAQLRFSWLKNDISYRKRNPRPFALAANIIDPKTCWMPLNTVGDALAHTPRLLKEKRMQKYKYVLNQFERDNPCRLLSYTHELTGNKYKNTQIADVYDFLEFYHVPDNHIWRSALGAYIYENYIAFVLDFGGQPRRAMVSDLVSATTFSSEECKEARGSCNACGKKHVMMYRVEYQVEDMITMDVGCVCIKRMEYIQNIGALMQDFRTVEFDIDLANVLITKMQSLQEVYRREAEADQIRFSS